MDEEQIRQIMDFLSEYDFLVRDEAGNRVRLQKVAQEFLAQTTTS
jgi:hypothetical protein